MGQMFGCMHVDQSTVALEESCGKFIGVLQPGCHCVPWYCGSHVVGKFQRKFRNSIEARCETKTKDDVFVTIVASIHYRELADDDARDPLETRASNAFYKVKNLGEQIQAFAIGAHVESLNLGEVFDQKKGMGATVVPELHKAVMPYGCDIVKIVILGIEPDVHVKRAMNEVVAATRLTEAATQKAAARKIMQATRAEGLANTINAFSKCLPNDKIDQHKDLIDLLLVTEYLDTMKEIGTSSKAFSLSNHQGPGAVRDVEAQIRDGLGLRVF